MNESLKMLVELFVKEYGEMKANFAYQHNLSSHLESQNESLRVSEQESAKKFARLKNLLSPKITWADGSPLYLSLFEVDALKEICEILKIDKGHQQALEEVEKFVNEVRKDEMVD